MHSPLKETCMLFYQKLNILDKFEALLFILSKQNSQLFLKFLTCLFLKKLNWQVNLAIYLCDFEIYIKNLIKLYFWNIF